MAAESVSGRKPSGSTSVATTASRTARMTGR